MENHDSHYSSKWAFHTFFRGIILFGFTMLILSMVLTGSISYYIAPKMMPFIYFALVVLFVLSVVQIIRSMPSPRKQEIDCSCEGHDHHHTGSPWVKGIVYAIFILPLLMGFMLPDKVLDSSVAAKRGVQLGSGIYSKPPVDTQLPVEQERRSLSTERADQFLAELGKEEGEEEHFSVEDMAFFDGFDDYYSKLALELIDQELIVVNEENFLDMMTVMDLYLDDFVEKSVQIVGFVYREPGMEQEQLVVARFSMTCCTADAAVYGLLASGAITRQFQNDTWVQLTGTIARTEYFGWDIPLVHVEEILEVEPPDTPYVYPNFN